jgi:hypothetical protein
MAMLNTLRDRALEKAAQWAPGRVAAAIDRLRPALADGFGGPFNGQQRRAEAIQEIFGRVKFQTVVETGTYRATTTRFLSQLASVPIATVEINSRYYHYARNVLVHEPNVTLIRGDSATVLESLSKRSPWSRDPTFFYLDAHWREHLPLRAELAAIRTGWRNFVVLIDDFQVPGDAGYAYDDYGPDRSLDLRILAPLVGHPIVIYWPAASSEMETGARRGWVVLATEGLIDESLRSIKTLNRAGPVPTI